MGIMHPVQIIKDGNAKISGIRKKGEEKG